VAESVPCESATRDQRPASANVPAGPPHSLKVAHAHWSIAQEVASRSLCWPHRPWRAASSARWHDFSRNRSEFAVDASEDCEKGKL